MIFQYLSTSLRQITRNGAPCSDNYQGLTLRISVLVACLWAVTSSLHAKIVFYSQRDGNWEIYTMNSDGSNQTRLTFNDAPDSTPVWSPNGRQIAFESDRDDDKNAHGAERNTNTEVYVMDSDGKNQRRLTHHPGIDGYPDWSPDGSQIAFDSNRDAKEGERKFEIYVMDADGSNVKQVTDVGFASRPRWSPDGEWILFEGGEIYAIRPDGTGLWQVSHPRFDAEPFLGGWSPDGKQVLYTEAVNFDPHNSFPVIATLASNGRAEVISWKPVPVPRMAVRSLAFSADGEAILFSDEQNIYRFELIGKQLTRLTDNPDGAATAPTAPTAPQEWDSRLSVPTQDLTPTHWGEVKSD